jgi:DNA topoisomerase III
LPVKSLASPELTGNWEARLSRVARGEETRAAFMADISKYVGDVVTAIRGGVRGMPPPTAAPAEAKARAESPRPPLQSTPQPPRSPAAAGPALTCPRCREGTLVAGHRGWGCSRWREGCAFVIWFQVAGHRITDAELGDLVSKGKTRRRKWLAQGGAEVSGRLVLDLAAARDAGAARLETAAGS